MIEPALAYLDDVGASRTVRKRIEQIMDIYARLEVGDIRHIFLTDYVNDDGVRQFQNLWLFTDTAYLECRLFLEKDDLDWMPRTRRIQYWRLESERYDYVQAIDASRLTVHLSFDHSGSGELKASGANCDHLLRTLTSFFQTKSQT